MAPTEDLIADRLGQWIASRRRDDEMRHQALSMFVLAEGLDAAYLDSRIRQETAGDLDLSFLESQRDAAHHPR